MWWGAQGKSLSDPKSYSTDKKAFRANERLSSHAAEHTHVPTGKESLRMLLGRAFVLWVDVPHSPRVSETRGPRGSFQLWQCVPSLIQQT